MSDDKTIVHFKSAPQSLQTDSKKRSRPDSLPESGRSLPVMTAPGNNVFSGVQHTSLHVVEGHVNPLVAAARPLLTEIVRLHTTENENYEVLHSRLESGIKSFETQALGIGIEHSHVMTARYLLCTAIDEAVVTSAVGEKSSWARVALLSQFHDETWGGEKFFVILDRMAQNPGKNIYILELMYLLISFGFEGKYRVMDRGPVDLEALRDNLYRQIRLLRGDPPSDIAINTITHYGDGKKLLLHIPVWLVVLIATICLGITFAGFSYTLSSHSEPVFEKYERLLNITE